jgi:hypothetical protein
VDGSREWEFEPQYTRWLQSMPSIPKQVCRGFQDGYCTQGPACKFQHRLVVQPGTQQRLATALLNQGFRGGEFTQGTAATEDSGSFEARRNLQHTVHAQPPPPPARAIFVPPAVTQPGRMEQGQRSTATMVQAIRGGKSSGKEQPTETGARSSKDKRRRRKPVLEHLQS